MSNLPLSDPYNNNNTEGSEFLISPLDLLGDSWSLYQEILQSDQINNGEIAVSNENGEVAMSSSAASQQHFVTLPQAEGGQLENELNLMKVSTNNTRNSSKITRKRNRKIIRSDENAAILLEQSAEEGTTSSSVAKKLDHNAKERIRRMKLNASYLALRALLPDSRRSKKRWSAPAIVDKVLKYIPELENEVEVLRSRKENVITEAKNKKIANDNSISQIQSPTISFTKVNEKEAIIQICMAIEDHDHNQDGSSFTNLLQSLEDEDICIRSASTLYIGKNIICYDLHIQHEEEVCT